MNRKTGIILSGIVGVVAGLWVWSAVIPKDSIQIGGSTSVSTVMTNLESAYKTYQENEKKNDKNKKADTFIYSSVGSAAGINSAKSGTYKMGFISKNLDNSVPGVTYIDSTKLPADIKSELDAIGSAKDIPDRQQKIYKYFTDVKKYSGTKDSDMHYVQIANDAIIIAYQAPKWFVDGFAKDFTVHMDADGNVTEASKDMMRNIYSGEWKWKDLAHDLVKQNPSLSKVNIPDDDADIKTLASAAGSGTKSVFDDKFGFDKEHPKDQLAPSVRSSDGFMYDSITQNNIGYLSMNYIGDIQNNPNLLTVNVEAGEVTVNAKDKEVFNPSKVSDYIKNKNGYLLTRPYIGVVSAKSSDDDLEKLSNLLGWIADGKNPETDAYKQYDKSKIAPAFSVDDSNLLPKGEANNSEKENSKESKTNQQLKKTIVEGYIRQH